MSKRDYKTSVADGMELEPLGGTGAVDKENSKVNGTQFGEGKCFNVRQQEQQHKKRIKLFELCARCVHRDCRFSTSFDLVYPVHLYSVSFPIMCVCTVHSAMEKLFINI